jgi:nucleoside-diphosphate-sugar epimerase
MMKLKKVEKGVYTGWACYGHRATVYRENGGWGWVLKKTGPDGEAVAFGEAATKKAAEAEIRDYCRETKTETTNLMSGKKIEISLADVGSCVDPGTERYWSM